MLATHEQSGGLMVGQDANSLIREVNLTDALVRRLAQKALE